MEASGMDLPLSVALLPVLKLQTHKGYQEIVKAFVTIQLPDYFFILIKCWYSQLLGIRQDHRLSRWLALTL